MTKMAILNVKLTRFPDFVPSRIGECYHKNNIIPRERRGHNNARSSANDPFWEENGTEISA